jgi:hypothetical protein
MADKKISALTASTTPLAGTEVLPIVQSGVTKQVSVANLTAGRAVNALSATTTSGLKNTSAGSDTASALDGLFLTDGANKNVIVQLGASGQLSTFVYEAGGAGWRRVAALLTNGNSVVDVGNLVIGTSGKGIDAPTGFGNFGSVYSTKGFATVATATPQTLVSTTTGLWIVYAYVVTGVATLYTSSAQILNDGLDARIIANNGTNLLLTLSGFSVQATQTSGINQTIRWSILKIE